MFYLAKIVWTLIIPGNLLIEGLIVATWLLGRRGFRGPVLHALRALSLLALAIWFTPLADWTIDPLEQWYRAPDPLPEKVDGIVVLGGWENMIQLAVHGQPGFTPSAERFFRGITLARKYPSAKLVFTGGSGDPLRPHLSGGDVAEAAALSFGIDRERLIIERKSRDTWENAMFSKALVQPRDGETWLLVTSASHMPRSMGCFRKAEWKVIPVPCDFVSTGGAWMPSIEAGVPLGRFQKGFHEWVGLAGYWMAGRI